MARVALNEDDEDDEDTSDDDNQQRRRQRQWECESKLSTKVHQRLDLVVDRLIRRLLWASCLRQGKVVLFHVFH